MSPVDPHYLHSVPGTDSIDVVVVADDGQGVRSLAFRHEFGQLLEFYVLFVRELAEVMDYFQRVPVFAVAAL